MSARREPGRTGAVSRRARSGAARFGRSFACLGRGIARLGRAQDGVAAVEFAMVLPLLLLLYFGTTDLANYISSFRKVTLSARAVADLLAREGGDVSTGQFATIVKAGRAVLAPYDGASARIAAKAIGVYGANGRAMVCSYALDAGNAGAPAPRGPTDVPSVPDAFKNAGARYLVVELSINYKPIFAASLAKRFNLGTLTESVVWPVRNGKVYNTSVTSTPEIVLATVMSNSNGGACPSQ